MRVVFQKNNVKLKVLVGYVSIPYEHKGTNSEKNPQEAGILGDIVAMVTSMDSKGFQ